ncbi:MAG TPA: hypothetical protein VGS78_03150 [Candidatus Sulfotelmatobacter sp.]|nr:hypothetical protein [Candidatus Sulfotelmatobacter sp.]
MEWARLVLVTIGAGVVTSMTDWFFAGDWIHRRFTYPEVWRKGSETLAIALTSPLPFLTCAAFAVLCGWLGIHSIGSAITLAAAIWLIGPLPMLLTNAAFMKLRRVFVTSYAAGWLVKLCVVGAATGWLLR